MAGLLDALAERDLLRRDAVSMLSRDRARDLLGAAALVAALTCARAGANPPRRAEVDAARAQPR
jgi:fructokinase